MALVIETGAGVPNAESYVTLAEVRAFAVSRGKVVPTDDAMLEAQVRTATDFLRQYESRFQGFRHFQDQGLAFPRWPVMLYNRLVPEGIIPVELKSAVCQLVIELQTRELLPTQSGTVVTKESVGPISTEYQVLSGLPSFPLVEAFLAPLMATGGLGLTSRRA